MTIRTQLLFAPEDDTGAAEVPAEPQSVADAIAANPDRFEAPEDPEASAPAAEEAPAEEVEEDPEVPEEPAEDPEDPEVPEDAPDPYQDFGGREVVDEAYRLYQAAQSEEGTVQILLEAAGRLGIGYDAIENLFKIQDQANITPADDEDDDPDRPMTAREFQDWQQKQAAEMAQREQKDRLERIQVAASQKVQQTAQELGIFPADDADEQSQKVYDAVLTLGDKYLDKASLEKGKFDPESIANAVRRGHADYLALVEKGTKEYRSKKQKAASVPSSPSGSAAPAAEPEAEPQSIEDTIARGREFLRKAGVM